VCRADFTSKERSGVGAKFWVCRRPIIVLKTRYFKQSKTQRAEVPQWIWRGQRSRAGERGGGGTLNHSWGGVVERHKISVGEWGIEQARTGNMEEGRRDNAQGKLSKKRNVEKHALQSKAFAQFNGASGKYVSSLRDESFPELRCRRKLGWVIGVEFEKL